MMKILSILLLAAGVLLPVQSIAQFRGHEYGAKIGEVLKGEGALAKQCVAAPADVAPGVVMYRCPIVMFGSSGDAVFIAQNGVFVAGGYQFDDRRGGFKSGVANTLWEEMISKYGKPIGASEGDEAWRTIAFWQQPWGVIMLKADIGASVMLMYNSSEFLKQVTDEAKRKREKDRKSL